MSSHLLRADAASIDELTDEVYRLACRTRLDVPGFCLIDLGRDAASREVRGAMARLAGLLACRYEAGRGLTLAPFSLGRFDQQVSTRFHLDGAPDESLLVLGYEPSAVEARLSIADYARAADDRDLGAGEYLDRFNPIFPAGEAALAGYVTDITEFRPSHGQLLVVNNSRAEVAPDRPVWRGVLHRAVIPAADPKRSRVINSMILAPADAADAFLPSEILTRFLSTDAISGEYRGRA